MDAHLRVQLINGDLFYLPNCTHDISLPDSEDVNELCSLLLRGGLMMENLQDPHWWTPQLEYLAFIPHSPVFFVGAFLEVLSLVPHKMDYREGEGYMLPPLLRNQWLVIDKMLTKAMEEVGNKHSLTYYDSSSMVLSLLFHYQINIISAILTFDFKLVHISGAKHRGPDELSRRRIAENKGKEGSEDIEEAKD
ncbi:hypothetical protein AN958_06254 [Leucoagaricus sp. SymC.cos]|nr:hypothetical protein AN958_06254 [Leucoagaricus sp. SymC.cos]